MNTLANILTILLLVVDVSRGTFGMGTLLVVPVMISMVALTRENRFYSVGAASVAVGLVYKESMLLSIDNLTNAQMASINQITTIVILAAYLLLYMFVYILLVTKQCKTEGPIDTLTKRFEIYSSATLTTFYLWALIMAIYLGCNGFFTQKNLVGISILTVLELCVAFVAVEALLRKAVFNEKAKRREQELNRTEVSSGTAN